MGFFDFFKRKNISKRQIRKSLNGYNKLLETGKNIKNAELINIPNSDLENVVMGWMWGMFNEDWSDQYEIITSLPNPCQAVYSCRTVTDEINNGGINQLFYNSAGQFAQLSIEGFDAMGFNALSGIMKQAVDLYKKNKNLWDYRFNSNNRFFNGRL